MSSNVIEYSLQISMLKQLLNMKLISEAEYEIIKKKIMKDYGIVSDLTS